ncbi:hypothetical protein B0H13DRAFT_2394389 [Mycena leptocephala]|nr:hypothetical protein B0H13DRAFT_2394389 [Mycena leptocephala]
MILLFLLSTIHIALAYTWAFITDRAQTGIYELFSLDNPLPVLYGPDDAAIVRRLGILIKIRYTLANAIADGIIIYRCYVIWGCNWRPVAFPAFSYTCTLIGGILGIIPLSGTSERAATAVWHGHHILHECSRCIISGRTNLVYFSPNCQASGEKFAKKIYGFDSYYARKRADISSRPGHLRRDFPIARDANSFGFNMHCCMLSIVGIAPTLIIVRVGLE